jgi:hypothetical protein
MGSTVGLDSVEIVIETEKAFGINLSDERTSHCICVGQLYSLVLEELPTSKFVEVDRECLKCGYNLRGLRDPRCPECGTPFFLDLGTSSGEDIWAILVDIICDNLGCRPHEVRPKTRFVEDLRMG